MIVRSGMSERTKGDERVLGDGSLVEEALEICQERLERRYRYQALGSDFDWLVDRVAEIFHIDSGKVTRAGRYPETVEVRSVLCYWAARELGVSTLELSERLGIYQPTASQSVKRGEKVVVEKKLNLVGWPISIYQYPLYIRRREVNFWKYSTAERYYRVERAVTS